MTDQNGKFAPQVQLIRARARRIVNTGRYESFEVQTEVEAVPDPNFKVVENIDRLQQLVMRKVNEAADPVAAAANNE